MQRQPHTLFVTKEPYPTPAFLFLTDVGNGIAVYQMPFFYGDSEYVRERCQIPVHCSAGALTRNRNSHLTILSEPKLSAGIRA